jgi:mono/diheme cytochrome c family protein
MKWTVTVAVALGAVAVLASTAAAQDAKVQKAMQIFTAQKCTQCHSIAGKGNKKGSLDDVGASLRPRIRNADRWDDQEADPP